MATIKDYSLDPEDIRYLFRNTKSYCVSCHTDKEETEKKQLLRCSRCKVCHYCSAACQKANFPIHRPLCRKIAAVRKEITDLEQQCKEHREVEGVPEEGLDLFLTDPGYFRHFTVGKVYVEKRSLLGFLITEIVFRSTDTVELGASMYEIALYEFYESFRLSPFVDGNENGFLFLLAALGYDNYAFSMVKFMTENRVSPFEHDEPTGHPVQELCNDTIKEGCWMFPLEPSFTWSIDAQAIMEENPQEIAYLFIMLNIKMKMLARLSIEKTPFDVYRDTSTGLRLTETEVVVSEYLLGDSSVLSNFKDEVTELVRALEGEALIRPYVSAILPPAEDQGLNYELVDALFNPTGSYHCQGRMVFLWRLYTSSFVRTPGLQDVFTEFVN